MNTINIPVGTSNFAEIRRKGSYFVDKSGLIGQLLKFAGLSIMENKELCKCWMNQYPTLFLTFRSVDGLNFTDAYAQLASVIAELYKKHIYLMDSDRIHPLDKEQFHRIAAEKADLKDIKNSLVKLTQLMELYHEKPVILLIDEYDVPRQYAKKVKHDGYKNVVALGVAFFQKKCLVKKQR